MHAGLTTVYETTVTFKCFAVGNTHTRGFLSSGVQRVALCKYDWPSGRMHTMHAKLTTVYGTSVFKLQLDFIVFTLLFYV